jgi:hypothetical protein
MLSLSPKGRPSVNEVLTMPFIRKEMGAYIKSQLGDESAASIVQDDVQALNYHQIEQARLEKQARKLGFDVQRRTDFVMQEPIIPAAPRMERVSVGVYVMCMYVRERERVHASVLHALETFVMVRACEPRSVSCAYSMCMHHMHTNICTELWSPDEHIHYLRPAV